MTGIITTLTKNDYSIVADSADNQTTLGQNLATLVSSTQYVITTVGTGFTINTGGGGGGGGVTDHGLLTGLADDDHPQYHNNARGDARYQQLGASAGGDLLGTYPNPTVSRVHGVDFQSGTPQASDVWIHNGTIWQHRNATKIDVGLSNVDNTSDANKPISTATQTALNGKQPLATVLTNTTASYTTAEQTKLAGIAAGATANLGTVTSFTFTNGGGFTGSVTNGSTTPALSLTLQNASGSQSGQLSSTDWNTFNSKQPAGSYLTGNQSINFTGDATGSGATSVNLTISNSAVTFAKVQNIATNRLLGRSTASAGIVEELTIGSGLALSGGVLTATGGGGGGNSVAVTCSFGASYTDKAQAVVTGQTWVTSTSEIIGQVLTPAGVDPDEIYLLDFKVVISDLVAGVGFTVTLYSMPKAKGNYSVMCIGV